MKKNIQRIQIQEIEEAKLIMESLFKQPREEAEASFQKLQYFASCRSFYGNRALYADIMLKIGEFYGRTSMLDKAIVVFDQVIDFSKKRKMKSVLFIALSNRAVCTAQNGEFREAIEIWEQMLKHKIDPPKEVNLLNNIAVGYNYAGDKVNHAKYIFMTIEACEKYHLEEMMASALINLGNYYAGDAKPQKALDSWLRAWPIAQRNDAHRTILTIANNISLAYNDFNDTEKALEYAYKGLEVGKKYAVETDLANVYNNIGFIHETAGNLDDALLNYRHARKIYTKSTLIAEHANCVTNFASVYIKMGEIKKALKSLEEANAIIKPRGDSPVQTRIFGKFAAVYEEMGDYEQAFRYTKILNGYLEDKVVKLKKDSITRSEADYYKNKIEEQAKTYRKQNIQLKKSNKIIQNTTRELEVANAKLSDTVETLNWMISVISHDVRAPLANYKRMLEIMVSGDVEQDEYQDILRSMSQGCDSVYNLVNGMLDGIRLQRRNVERDISLRRLKLLPILRSVEIVYRHIAAQKRINLSIHVHDESIEALVDEDLLQVVVRNLLNNAIKYTPEKGEITLSVSKDDDMVLLTMKDTGQGMDQATIRLVEEERLSELQKDKIKDGIGLGLSLCQDALKKMHSKLKIESKTGNGTLITVYIPA